MVGDRVYSTDDFEIDVSNDNAGIDGYNFCSQCAPVASPPLPPEVWKIMSLIHLSSFELDTLGSTDLPVAPPNPAAYERANSFRVAGFGAPPSPRPSSPSALPNSFEIYGRVEFITREQSERPPGATVH
jgi:hypothetical protein